MIEPLEITIRIAEREDGGLRVWSDDVPGFVLSHAERGKVLADIGPALTRIFSEMKGCDVRQVGATPRLYAGVGGREHATSRRLAFEARC